MIESLESRVLLSTVSIVASDANASEVGPDSGTFTVSRTGSTASSLTVSYSIGGTATNKTDYGVLSGSIEIAAGKSSATISVNPVQDGIGSEGNETVLLTLTADGMSPYTVDPQQDDATVTIADAPPALPTVSIAATDANASEVGPDAGEFTVSRTGDTTNALTVYYSTGGTATNKFDYGELFGSVQIAAGKSSVTNSIDPVQDTATAEGNETAVLTLSSNAGYTIDSKADQGTVTIADAPLIANDDVGFTERDTPVTINVLQNDTSPAGGLTVIAVTQGSSGAVTFGSSSVTYTPDDPAFYGDDSFQYQVQDASGSTQWATVDVYVLWIDLDVNNNGSILDSADGVENFLPGYVGGTAVLSTGSTFNDAQYAGQQVRVIVAGAGLDAELDSVNFELVNVTAYAGYSENTSDSAIEGAGKENDVSFAESQDDSEIIVTPSTLPAAGGEMEADQTWAALWIKDYGAKGTIEVTVQIDSVIATFFLAAPADADSDNVGDAWEEFMVGVWNTQYGAAEMGDNTFFAATDDKEMSDPDGAGNTDAGRDLPAHKTAGDSLTVRQEYRGFVLDGGGFSPAGTNGHNGGHIRLNPVTKQLLVEVDIMDNVAAMPSLSDIKTVLATTSKGFSDKDNGAGITMYWVIDEAAATHEVFANSQDRWDWADTHRNARLDDEFVHLMFVDSQAGLSGGITGVKGSFIFVTTEKSSHDTTYPTTDFKEFLSHTTAHELVHTLLNTDSANGFDASEHLDDPDPSDPANGPNDKKYLMYAGTTPDNVDTIIFSDLTIAQLDLKSKESVERV